jgi:hypothetical protein
MHIHNHYIKVKFNRPPYSGSPYVLVEEQAALVKVEQQTYPIQSSTHIHKQQLLQIQDFFFNP